MVIKRDPKKPDARRAWFKYQLNLAGSSFAAVGAKLGISRNAVSQSIMSPSDRVASVVAAELGRDKSELWPAKFRRL